MTSQEAKSAGRKKAIKTTAVVVAILLLLLMFHETRGDFANGILFYIQAITNIHVIICLAIVFCLTFFLGGKAGKDIILNDKSPIVISVTYSVLNYLAIYIYMAIVGITNKPDWVSNKNYLLPLAQTSIIAIIPIMFTWLWATYWMRSKSEKIEQYDNHQKKRDPFTDGNTFTGNNETISQWTYRTTYAIGGLANVGFAPNSDMLIVLSSQGEGIFDCIKGEKIARLHNDLRWHERFNEETNSIVGFDCLANIEITTCGLHGTDNLPKKTSDGWELTISNPEPDEKPFDKYLVQKIYLLTPDKKEKIFIDKDGACELRAYGFSETGNSFIIALSCNLVIYSRA